MGASRAMLVRDDRAAGHTAQLPVVDWPFAPFWWRFAKVFAYCARALGARHVAKTGRQEKGNRSRHFSDLYASLYKRTVRLKPDTTYCPSHYRIRLRAARFGGTSPSHLSHRVSGGNHGRRRNDRRLLRTRPPEAHERGGSKPRRPRDVSATKPAAAAPTRTRHAVSPATARQRATESTRSPQCEGRPRTQHRCALQKASI